MKKLIPGLGLLLMCGFVNAQGLENIIVEKYYVSDANDTAANPDGGVLPVNSVTYRVFVDMLPGYKFQAAFGIPGHELRIETTTLFFNNEDRGATSPTYTKTQAANNTVMLDSWLSVGAACTNNFGVLKADDDGMATITNNDLVLQNADTSAGIPLTTQDGLIAGTPEPVTTVGISTEIAVFDNQNDGTNGPLFTTFNGSWASLNGSIGPDTTENKVLIMQITTDGTLTFALNIQIGTPSGGVEQYVATTPVGNEILFPALNYTSIPTGVNEAKTEKSYSLVYPNPFSDKLSLEVTCENSTDNNYYAVYDSEGKIVMRNEFSVDSEFYSECIDMSTLPAGQYLIEISVDGKQSSKQIIKN